MLGFRVIMKKTGTFEKTTVWIAIATTRRY